MENNSLETTHLSDSITESELCICVEIRQVLSSYPSCSDSQPRVGNLNKAFFPTQSLTISPYSSPVCWNLIISISLEMGFQSIAQAGLELQGYSLAQPHRAASHSHGLCRQLVRGFSCRSLAVPHSMLFSSLFSPGYGTWSLICVRHALYSKLSPLFCFAEL